MRQDLLRQICLPPTATILDAVESLNKSRKGIVLVVAPDSRLLGTITDADVRHGLASRISLEEPVTTIANSNAVTLPDVTSHDEIVSRFVETRLRAIPILDNKGTVADCVFVDQVTAHAQTQRLLMIMAGGFGKRMGTLTESTPKPMLQVNGKPMMAHIIEQAAREYFEKVYISTHYLGDQIQDHFSDGRNFGVEIDYIEETRPLDTGGSFANIPVSQGPVVVTNADVLSGVGYSKMLDFHLLNNATVTIAVHQHIIQHPFGVVRSDGINFIGIDEKPRWVTSINAGIYVLDASVKKMIGHDEPISMPDVIHRVKQSDGRVVVFPLHENWTDLGSEAQYLKLND
jgi:dTDP-glucose pyrophosphorylase